MAKTMKMKQQQQGTRPRRARAPKRGRGPATTYFSPIVRTHSVSEPKVDLTSEKYARMTPAGRAFLSRMQANPHVDRALKDLADR